MLTLWLVLLVPCSLSPAPRPILVFGLLQVLSGCYAFLLIYGFLWAWRNVRQELHSALSLLSRKGNRD